MKLFDKLKNIFIEEELVNEEQVPVISKVSEEVEDKPKIVEEPKKEMTKVSEDISDRSLIDTNQKFKFPIIFEDDDFKEEKKVTKSINVLERETVKYEPEVKKDIRDLRKEKKSFKPSPIISPVYGVLDKNYAKEDVSAKDGFLHDYDKKVDIDSVMKKAYGNEKTIETAIKENEKEDEINLFEDSITNEKTTTEEIDNNIKSIDDLLKDTTDDDFYSLVDNMYKDEEGDSEDGNN